VAACILVSCLLLGAQVLSTTRLAPSTNPSLPTAERVLFSVAAGMLLIALIVLLLGLLGLLRPWVLYTVVVAAALAGAKQAPFLWGAADQAARMVGRGLFGPTRRRALHVFLAGWAMLTLLSALAPPNDLDDDGLSQHLAAPKTYLRHAHIHPLWYDHHSQFPAALQMLFTVALATGQVEAAKVLHWACGVLAALTLIVIGRRFLSPAAGEWAAFALLVTPAVGALSTVAYVDLASVFLAALLLLAFLRCRSPLLEEGGQGGRSRSPLLKGGGQGGRDVALAGLAAGGGMAVKMQGLQIFGVALLLLAIAALLARETVARAARRLGVFVLVAALPAAPWYLKSFLWTGNPVYPFAYGVFGGKYWGPAEAAQYRDHQLGFGIGVPPPAAEREQMGFLRRTFYGPRAPLNLLLAPWNLTMRPREFDVLTMNPVYAVMSAGVGPLLLAVLPLVLLTGAPRPLRWSLAFLGLLWLAWLMLMQYNRYLVPVLVFAAVPAGFVLGEGVPAGIARRALRGVAWCCGALALLYLAVGGLLGGSWAAGIGLVPRDVYLRTTSQCWRFSDWVNRVTPTRAKIALYAEPKGFYLDRDYLWADPGHSRLIEYEKITSPEDLLDAYSRLGVTHVLYHRLPGTQELFELEPYGTELGELERSGEVSVVGHPPDDPSYVLLAIETPWARELTR